MAHCASSANRLIAGDDVSDKTAAMTGEFQKAFIWHLETTGRKMSDVVRATGVSRDVLAKLSTRPGSSTTVENGMLIAAFFGKTVNQFVAKAEASDLDRIAAIAELLTPEERRLVEAQIRGLAAAR